MTTYQVSLKEGKLTVELAPDKKRSEAAPAGLLPAWIVGLGITSCLVWLGLWLTRRS